jgi:hypothetical protein
MRFSQPLVLLLGSILSASGIGCSAISAVVTDSRPANRENRSDTDRLAAIGRVFENQGRYDRAEVMYRKALKSRPQDQEVRNQLQQLAARRQEQKFGPSGTANAIAMADVVSPPKSGVEQVHGNRSMAPNPMPPAIPQQTQPVYIPARGPQPQLQWNQQPQFPATQLTYPVHPVTNAASQNPNVRPQGPVTVNEHFSTADSKGWRSRQTDSVSSDDILVALEQPDEHIDLLLKAVSHGDNIETKALAATLLGDCDPGNLQVRDALVQQLGVQVEPAVLIAVCDSQIERNEADRQTANCLVCLCTGFHSETQIQAASQLRSFVGTEHEASCLTALNELLGSEEPNVRATAALTLGDFNSMSGSTRTCLHDLAGSDPVEAVRNAARTTLTRQKSESLQVIPASNVTSK